MFSSWHRCNTAGWPQAKSDLYNTTREIGKRKKARKARAKSKTARKARRKSR